MELEKLEDEEEEIGREHGLADWMMEKAIKAFFAHLKVCKSLTCTSQPDDQAHPVSATDGVTASTAAGSGGAGFAIAAAPTA